MIGNVGDMGDITLGILGVVGVAAFVVAFFWAQLGKARIEMLEGYNQAQDRRIGELESELELNRQDGERVRAALDAAHARIAVLERLVTGHEVVKEQGDRIVELVTRQHEDLRNLVIRRGLAAGG